MFLIYLFVISWLQLLILIFISLRLSFMTQSIQIDTKEIK